MCTENKTNEVLEVASQILARCVVMGLVVLLFWWGVLVVAGDWAYNVHSSFFPMSRQQFSLVHYTGIMATKLAVSLLFLLPYVAVRLVLRKRGRTDVG